MKIGKLIDRIFFPDEFSCIVCGGEMLPAAYGVCPDCTLPVNDDFCVKCGAPFHSMSEYCGRCKVTEREFERARAPYIYDGKAAALIKRFKFDNAKYLYKYFARAMADCGAGNFPNAQAIVYVPLSQERLKERGYNQSQLLAREVARLTNLPLIENALIKITQHMSQSMSSAKQRAENIKGTIIFGAEKAEIKGKTLLLIDDIITTGATTGECARILKKAGAKSVYVLTACATPYSVPLGASSEMPDDAQ